MTKKDLSVEEQNRILSGNRWGQQNGAPAGGLPPRFPPPGALPSDPYFAAIQSARRARTFALAGLISTTLIAGMFVAVTIRLHRVTHERDAARVVCERLPIALQGVRTSITRGNPDSLEIAQRASAASLILNMVLGPCIGDDNAPSFYAQRLTEANDAAAVNAVIDEMIARLTP